MATVIGNDVVHLADPEIAAHHLRSRFVERVCSGQEVERLGCSEAPHRLLWTLFAAKEAAYKAAMKRRPNIAFAPRRFDVDAQLTRVTYQGWELALRIAYASDWVHAVACSGAAPPAGYVERLVAGVDQSQGVRELAMRAFAGDFDLPPSQLQIVRAAVRGARDGRGPPRLLLDGQPLPIDISLSHDGPYVACAAVATSS